jgi:hypothetical protein
MNKPIQHHNLLVKRLINEMIKQGVTSDKEQDKHYLRLRQDPNNCHLALNGFSNETIFIKTVNAEDNANQSNGCLRQITEMIDQGVLPVFVYAGIGWRKKAKYKEALVTLRNMLGKEKVVRVEDYKDWFKDKIKEVSR